MEDLKRTLTSMTVAGGLLLAACGTDTDNPSAVDDSTAEVADDSESEVADEPESEVEPQPDIEPEPEIDAIEDDVPEDDTLVRPLWLGEQDAERGGLVLTVTQLFRVDVDLFEGSERDMMDDDTTTVLALNVELENTSDNTLTVHPAQGELVVATEQIDAQLLLSDNIGGDIHAGVQKDGLVLFESTQTPTEVEEVGSAPYLVRAPHHDLDRLGEDIDLTFAW